LVPEVAEAALRSASGYRWLAETGQLVVPGLDIDRIDGAPPPDWMSTKPPTMLFAHDPDRLDRLCRSLEQHLERHGWPDDPWKKPKPGIRELLLRFLNGKLASGHDRNIGTAGKRTKSVPGPTQGDRNE
jgi:hypothetical protein